MTASATAGLYTGIDFVFDVELYGVFDFSVKLSTVPFAVNPISTSASWTHPIALSQGEEMTGVINAGYDMTIGGVQVYYYLNHLLPKVSILDFILDSANSKILPSADAFSWTWA